MGPDFLPSRQTQGIAVSSLLSKDAVVNSSSRETKGPSARAFFSEFMVRILNVLICNMG